MKNRFILLTIFSIFTSGCSLYEPVKQGTYRNYFEKFSTQIVSDDWMANPFSDGFLMSKDGFGISFVYVDRQKLNKDLGVTKQRFTKDMNPYELAEVQLDMINSHPGLTHFKLLSNDPAKIDGHSGYRIEYQYMSYKGLDIKSVRYGFIYKKWMYHIYYEGLAEHYYDKYEEEFEQFVKTFKVL